LVFLIGLLRRNIAGRAKTAHPGSLATFTLFVLGEIVAFGLVWQVSHEGSLSICHPVIMDAHPTSVVALGCVSVGGSLFEPAPAHSGLIEASYSSFLVNSDLTVSAFAQWLFRH